MADANPLLPIRVLHDFVERLEKLGIAHMLTGSLAMFQYSTYRMTADIDIVIEIDSATGERLANSISMDYYVPIDSMRGAIRSKRMFNLLHQETAFKVDCVMRKDTAFHSNAFKGRQVVDFHGKEIRIITAADLILSKLWWASDSHFEKQLGDVRNLIRNQLDFDYIEKWFKELGVIDLLERCKSEI